MKNTALDSLNRAFEHRDVKKSAILKRLKVDGLPGFKDFDIEPETDFIAICGGTGTGKTALLEILFVAMGSQARLPERQLGRLGSPHIKLDMKMEEEASSQDFDMLLDNPPDPYRANVDLLDLSRRTIGPVLFYREKGIESVQEGSSFKNFDRKLLALCSFICRKDYKDIAFIEVEDDDERFPFFKIETAKTSYDSLSASTGELSVLYLAWALSNSEPHSIFLIEEPESFLPPVGQAAIIYLIFKAIIDNGHSVILTTHSADIVSKVPEGSIISLRNFQGITEIVGDDSKNRVLSKLGLGPSRKAILFVEDEAAKDVTEEMLSSSPLADIVSFEVAKAGDGDGAVKKATCAVPANLSTVTALGILDGDMRERAAKWPSAERFCFTPFEEGIEIEMLKAIENDLDLFAERIGRTREQCLDAFEVSQGLEVHEKFAATAQALGVTNKTLRAYAFPHWLQFGDNGQKATTFLKDIAGKIGLPN